MQAQKNSFPGVWNIVLTVFVLLAAGFLGYVTACAIRGNPVMLSGRCIMQVVTGSMEPTLHVGDCILMEQVPPESLSVGDIIAYTSKAEDIAGMTVTHRITECLPDGSFLTKGDANPVADALPVQPEQVQGRFVRKSRFFSWLTSFANLRKVLLLAVMLIVSGMALYEVRTVMQLSREIHDENAAEQRERLMRQAIEKEKQRLREENYQPEQEEGKQK